MSRAVPPDRDLAGAPAMTAKGRVVRAAGYGLDSGVSTCEAVHKTVRTRPGPQEVPPEAAAAEPARGTGAPSTPPQPAGEAAAAATPRRAAAPGAAAASGTAEEEADVIVVGAGPAGSATAYYLANAGLDVLLLEKATFPREKVCGDGLTPRGVRALLGMGVTPDLKDGWRENKGLRIIGGGVRLELRWPELSDYPGYGLVRTRLGFDETLARTAEKAGVRLLEGVNVTGPVLDDEGRIVGGTARRQPAAAEAGAAAAVKTDIDAQRTYRARLVVAADGNSSRLSLAMGLRKRDDRPLGVAVRTYYTSPRHDDDYLESWLELRDGDRLLPGYGWIFGMGDGTSNVGLGLLNTSAAFQNIDYRGMLRRWLAGMPAEWGYTESPRHDDDYLESWLELRDGDRLLPGYGW